MRHNLYGLAVSQKLSLNGFKWAEDLSDFDQGFIISYNEKSKEGYFIFDIQYLKNLQNIRNDLPFLPERMNIEKVEKVIPNLHDKNEYVIHIRILKQSLNHGLVFKTVA